MIKSGIASGHLHCVAAELARRSVASPNESHRQALGEQPRRLNQTPRSPRARAGFTLVELLVVIGIILILIGLLFPAISAVRRQAAASATRQEMSRLQSAINAYYLDFRAYPGPVPEPMLATPTVTSAPYCISTAYPLTGINGSPTPTVVTGSENLFLGLCGGLTFPGTTGTPIFGYTAPVSGPLGPASLNAANPKTQLAYMNYSPNETTYDGSPDAGFASNAGDSSLYANPSATDSCIPEFIDHFNPARPILYLRARVGIACSATANTMLNPIGASNASSCQYDENQLVPYGWAASYTTQSNGSPSTTSMGVSTTDFPAPPTPSGDFAYTPDDAYFANPAVWGTPIGKDGYILISAGPDGIYGTKDDIVLGSGS